MTAALKAETQTRAKKAPAKATPAKAAAKPAAKKVAEKAAPTPAARKLRWLVDGGDRAMAGKVGQSASVEGYLYRIEKAGDAWTATVTVDGKAETLSDTTFAKAYAACVEHNRAR